MSGQSGAFASLRETERAPQRLPIVGYARPDDRHRTEGEKQGDDRRNSLKHRNNSNISDGSTEPWKRLWLTLVPCSRFVRSMSSLDFRQGHR
jgi:hypothetical protein